MEKNRHAELAKQMEKEADITRRRANENLLSGLHQQSEADISDHQHSQLDETSTSMDDGFEVMSELSNTESIADVIYEYKPLEIDILGPYLPSSNDITLQGYTRHVRDSTPKDLGGGYINATACSRALHDAFGGLLFSPSSVATNVL